jgi:hypothetical protein
MSRRIDFWNSLESRVVETLENRERDGLIRGLGTADRRVALAKQIVQSYRRIQYVDIMKARGVSRASRDSSNELFDPLKASIAFMQENRLDESYWLVFYFVHFGKNLRGGWRYAREVYNALGKSDPWNWEKTSNDPKAFRKWLRDNQNGLKRKGVPGGFGNHRKYQSLDAVANDQTGAAFESYVEWIGDSKSHEKRFNEILQHSNDDAGSRFDALFRSMSAVSSFGRMAKFDYLCMIGKLGLLEIEPACVYIDTATGPKAGGKLLFGGSSEATRSNSQLEKEYADLADSLQLPFCMQILEDAICNWQKNPDSYKPFRG